MSLFHAGLQTALDGNGDPINGATWSFFLQGTSTPATVYSSSSMATALGTVVTSNAAGRFATIFLNDEVSYRAILKDAGGAIIRDLDPANPDQGISVVSVTQFGATGDGVTDDTDAIQAAFNTGKDIYFPNGTYMVQAYPAIQPVSNQTIRLEKGATLQALGNIYAQNYVLRITDVENVTVEGGRFVGERYTHLPSGSGYATGDVVNVVAVTGSGTGMTATVTLADNGRIQTLTVLAAGSGYVDGDEVSLTANTGAGSGASAVIATSNGAKLPYLGEGGLGIAVYNSTNITIRDVRCEDCWGDGIYVGGTDLTGTSRNVMIINALCENNRRNGMTVAAVDGMTIVGGQYKGSQGVVGAECGIDFEPNISGSVYKAPAKNITCDGVIAKDNAGPGFGCANPHLSNLEFYGCESRDNGDAGFYFGSVGPGCKVVGGRSEGNATHGAYVFGSAPTVTMRIQFEGLDAHNNTLDGIFLAGSVLGAQVRGGFVSHNGRHGIHLERTLGTYTDRILVQGVEAFNNSQTTDLAADNIYVGANCHYVRVMDCTVRKQEPTSIIASVTTTPTNRPRYGVNVTDNEATIELKLNDVVNGGQTGNIAHQALTVLRDNTGFKTENRVLSSNIDISSTGNKTVTIPHGCAYTPSVEHCQVSIVDTASAGGDFQPARIQSVDATNVTVRLNVLTAVAASNVKLALAVERP